MWKTYKTQNYYTHKNKYLILFHLTLLEIFSFETILSKHILHPL
ncbi:hypothetical protein QCK_2791 [Clostridioides difficile CD45]|nr:hypothetical protein QAY_2583 [Clostridioides difficile CD18]EQE42811.1 hypothetical protein QCC_2599 [Clostridioides difficile CD41]EQE47550.1 hypothetical protein QCE_2704 [Clostridioides difficile CD42]EQE52851.1 hypothetical protein QCG_2827 [Clostridioides difficile CD43]EQE60619.1 hypothetical protein QCK_2791 [Clostridioides difficile CD45]EQE90619.1 hypothetical protein QE9_2667 [Clostridioides difficile CD104]EQE91419.1 hypothetical protein QCY_2679 [Clostridioides difficile CD70]